MVAWLKVLLPLVALGLLSTLFLLSRGSEPSAGPDFDDIDERMRDRRITRPVYTALTDSGDELRFTAETVNPALTGGMSSARDLTARLDLQGGDVIDLSASRGGIDPAEGEVTLRGDVEIDTRGGFALRSELLNARLKETWLHSPGAVSGRAPFGEIEAGGMTLNGDAPGHLQFTDSVKLIYDPRADRGE